MATAFEGGLLLLAGGIGHLVQLDPMDLLKAEPQVLIYALLGTVPLYGLLVLTDHLPSLKSLQSLLVERLGRLLAAMNRLEIIYLGFLAGTTEEFLFRGILQPWFEQEWGYVTGLLFSNLIFALVHWATPVYALIAGLMGTYLGLSLDFGPERNLAIPLLIHALYDIIALNAIATLWRKSELSTQGWTGS